MPEELPVTDGAPEATQNQAQPDTDWQKRYTDTHANWNTLNEQMTRFKSDPNAVIDFLRETHPDLLVGDDADEEEEEETFDEDDDARPMTVAEFKAHQREQAQTSAQEKGRAQYETDLRKFVGDRELSPFGERSIRAAQVKSPDDLKKAVEDWFEYVDSLGTPKPKPRAPHIPARGKAVTGGKAWSEMTREEALAAQMELAASLDTPV